MVQTPRKEFVIFSMDLIQVPFLQNPRNVSLPSSQTLLACSVYMWLSLVFQGCTSVTDSSSNAIAAQGRTLEAFVVKLCSKN